MPLPIEPSPSPSPHSPSPSPSPTPCTTVQCLEGEIFNMTTCECEFDGILPPILPPDISPSPKPNNNTINNTCNEVPCLPGQAFHKQSCKCLCLLIRRCPGNAKFDKRSCNCKCKSIQLCSSHGYYFDHYLCTCMSQYIAPPLPYYPHYPQYPNPAPPIVPPTTPPTAPPTQQHCSPFARERCQNYELFDSTTCQCYCPSNAIQHCTNRLQSLDTNTCQCKCIVQQTCAFNQYFDSNDCMCKCHQITVCNSDLQQLDPNTCQCQCSKVIVFVQVSFNGRGKRHTNFITRPGNTGQLISIHSSNLQFVVRQKRHKKVSLSREKRRTPTNGRTRSKSNRPGTQRTMLLIERRIIPGTSCPQNTHMNPNTCECF